MALVRVKRRLNEDPVDALVLQTKRAKNDALPAVFQFAATVDMKEHVKNYCIKEVVSHKLGTTHKHSISLKDRVRAQRKAVSDEGRLKVVNCFRSIEPNIDTDEENEEKTLITVVDIEPENSRLTDGTDSTDENCVYDLYYSDIPYVNEILLENFPGENWSEEELVFRHYRSESEASSEEVDDDEDSNDENNPRNDYPDEDELRLSERISRCYLADDSDPEFDEERSLSSDEYDENLLYGDPEDIQRYGRSYAAYKARNRSEADSDDDDEPDDPDFV